MSDNKFFDVFIGPPWSGVCDTWPGVNTLGDGSTISNYYKFPLPAIDPPTSGWRTPGGFVTGGGKKKSKKSKKIKRNKKSSRKKYKKSKKNRKSKKR
jgi:hypothetical protein